jgi:hypothetical protein
VGVDLNRQRRKKANLPDNDEKDLEFIPSILPVMSKPIRAKTYDFPPRNNVVIVPVSERPQRMVLSAWVKALSGKWSSKEVRIKPGDPPRDSDASKPDEPGVVPSVPSAE